MRAPPIKRCKCPCPEKKEQTHRVLLCGKHYINNYKHICKQLVSSHNDRCFISVPTATPFLHAAPREARDLLKPDGVENGQADSPRVVDVLGPVRVVGVDLQLGSLESTRSYLAKGIRTDLVCLGGSRFWSLKTSRRADWGWGWSQSMMAFRSTCH